MKNTIKNRFIYSLFTASSTINSDLYDIFKSEDIEMDDNVCEFDTINPDDFLNESFLNELKVCKIYNKTCYSNVI